MEKSTSLSSGIARLEKALSQEGLILDFVTGTNTETISAEDSKYHNAPEGAYHCIDARILIPKTVISPSS
ncbi:MAG: hypothetical protein WCK00_06430 [Deltaproteobacteria bacterium]